MKFINSTIIFFLILSVVIFSCKKEEEIVLPSNCTLEVNSSHITNNTESFTNNPISPITGKNGTEISFTSGSFTGIPARIDVLDSQDNKDMLLMGYPTIDNNGGLLISAGVCFISAYDADGNILSINPAAAPTINVPNTTNSGDMNVYSASENINGEFVWDDQNMTITPNTTTNEYQNVIVPNSSLSSFSGGVNMDIPRSPCVTSILTINLPDGRNGNNSSVYIYFTNQNSSVTAYDGDSKDGVFEVSNIFCAGDSVQFVVVSQIEGVRKYFVSSPQEVSLGNTWTRNILNEDFNIALCADALRLLIKEELQ
jgi:hypothetical protein